MLIRIKVIKSINELESLKNEWNMLLKESCCDAVYLTHEWIMAWWDAFGNGSSLFVIIVYNVYKNEEKKIIGIAPFMKFKTTYRGVNAVSLSLMANGHSPSSGIIVRDEHTEDVIGALMDYMESLSDIDLIEFKKLTSTDSSCLYLRSCLEKKKALTGIKPNTESPVIKIDGEWEAFLNSRSYSFRKSLRNKVNRANKEPDLHVEKLLVKSGTDSALDEMFSISEKSWKKEISNDLMNIHYRNFHKGLCDRLGPQGVVTLWFLRKGPLAIAFEFHLTYNGIAYPIRADYDESFSKLSPGSVLESHILKTIFNESEVKEYNSCGHTYDYLMNWTEHTIKHTDIEVFPQRLKSYGLNLLEYRVIPMLKRYRLDEFRKILEFAG